MKIAKSGVVALVLALSLAASVHAQNVGIGYSNPQSKLTVNGNFALGADYNLAAPPNGALIEGTTGIGTTTPEGVNSFLTVASTGQSNITLLAAPVGKAPAIRSGIFFGSTYFECTDSPSNGTKDITFFNIPTQTNVLTLSPTNSVGIITTTPVVPLDVRSAQSPNLGAGTEANFYYGSSALVPSQPVPANSYTLTAYFQDRIISGSAIISLNGTVTASDARLKNIIGKSDGAKDLETLGKIEVTDYTMKDTVKFGSAPFKKVVAQQVEKVYPTAVKTIGFKGLTYIPDIFVLSSKVEKGRDGTAITISKAHGLRVGDSVRLVTDRNTEMEFDVTKVVDANTFVIKTDAATKLSDKIFVYGKYCPDMKAIDYEAISMLNVSATQELSKKVQILEKDKFELQSRAKLLTDVEEEQRVMISKQQQQIADQAAEIAALKSLASDVEVLKQAVTRMREQQHGGVRAVALEQ